MFLDGSYLIQLFWIIIYVCCLIGSAIVEYIFNFELNSKYNDDSKRRNSILNIYIELNLPIILIFLIVFVQMNASRYMNKQVLLVSKSVKDLVFDSKAIKKLKSTNEKFLTETLSNLKQIIIWFERYSFYLPRDYFVNQGDSVQPKIKIKSGSQHEDSVDSSSHHENESEMNSSNTNSSKQSKFENSTTENNVTVLKSERYSDTDSVSSSNSNKKESKSTDGSDGDKSDSSNSGQSTSLRKFVMSLQKKPCVSVITHFSISKVIQDYSKIFSTLLNYSNVLELPDTAQFIWEDPSKESKESSLQKEDVSYNSNVVNVTTTPSTNLNIDLNEMKGIAIVSIYKTILDSIRELSQRYGGSISSFFGDVIITSWNTQKKFLNCENSVAMFALEVEKAIKKALNSIAQTDINKDLLNFLKEKVTAQSVIFNEESLYSNYGATNVLKVDFFYSNFGKIKYLINLSRITGAKVIFSSHLMDQLKYSYCFFPIKTVLRNQQKETFYELLFSVMEKKSDEEWLYEIEKGEARKKEAFPNIDIHHRAYTLFYIEGKKEEALNLLKDLKTEREISLSQKISENL